MKQVYITFILFTAYLVNGNIVKHSDEVEFNFFDDSSYSSSQCKTSDFHHLPQHIAGYIDIKSDTENKGSYFYALIENRYKLPNLPLLLWSDGGPGVSSIRGLFYGNGPYSLQNDLTLCWSEYGWDQYHNILIVDHPYDVGYSYSVDDDIVYGAYTVADDMLQFLYSFFERHPELISNDFYLTGLSFAGHYLPSIGDAILKGNKENKDVYINLKGMELGNPYINSNLHCKSFPTYAYEQDIITGKVENDMLKLWPECDQALITYCDYTIEDIDMDLCVQYYEKECGETLFYPLFTYEPELYQFDIRGQCFNEKRCTNLELMDSFLNLDNVKNRLNVPKDVKWISSNDEVYDKLYWLTGTDFTPFIEGLLDAELKIAINVGTYDLISNWIGTEYWMEDLDWKYKNEWNAIEIENYSVNGNIVGKKKSSYKLTYATVDNAAHWVVEDQPEVALSLILDLTYDEKRIITF